MPKLFDKDKRMDFTKFNWTREPDSYRINKDSIEIITKPHTDLWQRTYYHFQNDNAPVLQMETEEKYFSFVVKTEFEDSHCRFDQCGVVMYLDSKNWLKASIEYENQIWYLCMLSRRIIIQSCFQQYEHNRMSMVSS